MEYYILLIKQNKNKAKKSQKGKKGNVLISTSLLYMHIHVSNIYQLCYVYYYYKRGSIRSIKQTNELLTRKL